jgi:hypothetical protein
MPAGNLGHGDVKAICDKLECSPSQHDATGYHGGAPNIVPTAKSTNSATTGTHLSTHTSEFKQKVSSGRDSKSGYKGKYAKGAREE